MMSRQKQYVRSMVVCLVSTATLLFFTSCEEVLEDFKVPNEGESLVVDGRITDHDSAFVKLSRTAPYFNEAAAPLETGATVTLKRSVGSDIPLTETNPGISGVYSSSDSGIIGVSYHIEIMLTNGDQYVSDPEVLKAAPVIDTAFWEIVEEDGETLYEVLFTATDFPGQEDYYRWTYYINGVLGNEPSDLGIGDDRLYEGNKVERITLNNDFLEFGDTMQIEQFSISEAYYTFLEGLVNNTDDQGSPFSSPPIPLVGNVHKVGSTSEFALGYFYTSAVVSAEVVAGKKNF